MQPTYFINHGGGPCFFLEPGPMRDTWSELEAYLRGFANTPARAARTAPAPQTKPVRSHPIPCSCLQVGKSADTLKGVILNAVAAALLPS